MSTVHHNFHGYGAYPLSESETMIRERLMSCLNALREKNDGCLGKAREQGKEKLMSQILSVKTRMERISSEAEKAMGGASYRFDVIPIKDEAAAKDIDGRIEALMAECGGIIDFLTCVESDMHIIERYTHIMSNLSKIEKLFHERMIIFKRMQIYG